MTTTGMFSSCDQKWDENNQEFVDATKLDVLKCCNKKCTKPVSFCYKYCSDNTRSGGLFENKRKFDLCMKACDCERILCLDTCSLIDPSVGMQNQYFKCAEANGCDIGRSGIPNKDCVTKNKERIKNCCLDNCVPSQDLDCNSLCDYFENVVLKPDPIMKERVYNFAFIKKQTSSENRNRKYIYIILFISIICFVLLSRK